VFGSYQELAESPEVDLIDVATRPSDRYDLVAALLAYGKPLLVQKPLSYDLATATDLCMRIAASGVPVAVNHNARWMPVQEKLHGWLSAGLLGSLYAVHHINRFDEDISAWYTDHQDYMFLDHGLHYIDLLRWQTGRQPEAVAAVSVKRPGQLAKCPLSYAIMFRYRNEEAPLQASLVFNNAVGPASAYECGWYFDGALGTAKLTLDTITHIPHDGTRTTTDVLAGGWIPDGFVGAYREFVRAVAENKPAPHSAQDHLLTLAAASAAAKSARDGGSWQLIEVPIRA